MKRNLFFFLLFLCPVLSFAMALPLPGPATHTAVNDGAWHLPSTWGGTVPGNNAIVVIPQGRLVTVTRQEAARIKFIQIEGELRMSIHQNCRLLVETMQVSPSGSFLIGLPAFPVKPGKTSEIVFISDGNPIDLNWDPNQLSRGLLSMGKVALYGQPVTHMSEMRGSIYKGNSLLNLGVPVPTDWKVGDSIVLTGSYFHRDEAFQDEVFAIQGISGNSITLDRPTQFDHLRVRVDMHLHVANLRRSIIFRSESTDIGLRGHIMLMKPDVDFFHVAFQDLGRTNKNIPLDEIVVDINSGAISPGPFNNRRGRYPVHFHKNGIEPGLPAPSKVHGCVVQRTPGWGFVNHSSHVDFQKNVCHDFLGAGFVTESGDELGNFIENIAIHGTGEDAPGTSGAQYDQKYKPVRLVFDNPYRPQVISDFAFSGDGFWFQGPAVRAVDNVANSCNGSGMIWFNTGAIEIDTDKYVGFPKSVLNLAYAGYPNLANLKARTWSYAPKDVVISDLPVLECNGLDAYACLVGFRFRFANFENISFYQEGQRPWDYAQDIVPLPGRPIAYAERIRQKVENLNLWNNEQGFRMRYVEKTDFVNVKNINRLDYHVRTPYHGAEHLFRTESIHFDNLITSGYAVAGWTISDGFDNTNEVSFSQRVYSAFSNADKRKKSIPCAQIFNANHTNVTPNSVTLTWNGHPLAGRFLIRFKPVNAQKWRFVNPVGFGTTSTSLSGLLPNTNYVFQINAGCPENVSVWSWPAYFTTAPSQKTHGTPVADVKVYPNPVTTGPLFLTAPADVSRLAMYDVRGVRVAQWMAHQRKLEMPDDLAEGLYILRIQTPDGVRNLRIVKQ